jgi:cell wall-associated NlpC family hydrolase
MAAWRAAGVSLPHNSAEQYAAVAHISKSELRPGDLVFYYSPIHHVAIYIGNGMMVNAPYTGAFIRIDGMYRPGGLIGAVRPAG